MPMKIRSVDLSHATPGMILAAPVCDASGATLLAEGAELTASMLAALERREIIQLQIAEEELLTAEESAARRTAVYERLDFLFRGSDNPLKNTLHKILLDYRLEDLQ